MLVATSPGRADAGGCQIASIAGQSQADATGAFIGAGTLTIFGKVTEVTWVSVITSTSVDADGSLSLVGSHHVVSDPASSIDFTTSDVVSALPTDTPGVYVFSSHLVVRSGQGRVNRGTLDVAGHVDLVHGHVVIDSSNGLLCAGP